jgi:alanine or glycine:cation symporter, AGCS family
LTSFKLLFRKSEQRGEGNISHYQAIASVLAGNFGTGNISGMAVALETGGPGALIWMWIMAFFGAAIQYANCLLGIKYRKNSEGNFIGGPMYYLRDGLGLNKLAMIFSCCTLFGAFTVGNLAQVNSMSLPLENLGLPPFATGCFLAFCVALVILGGMQRVAKVSAAVVPIMALLYLAVALFILATHLDQVGSVCTSIYTSLFGKKAALGGACGFSMMQVITTGFDRAIFATDAGTGTVPMLQAGSRTKDPVFAGIVSLVSPFIVMFVCTTTAFVLLISDAPSTGLKSTNMVAFAFEYGMGRLGGSWIVILSLVLFGYTTSLAWASCLERAVEFLFGKRYIRPMQLLYIVLVPAGAVMRVDFVWILADISLSLMVVINLVGVAGLSKEVIGDSRKHLFIKGAI